MKDLIANRLEFSDKHFLLQNNTCIHCRRTFKGFVEWTMKPLWLEFMSEDDLLFLLCEILYYIFTHIIFVFEIWFYPTLKLCFEMSIWCFPECFHWFFQCQFFIRICKLLCKRPGCYHSASNRLVTDRIIKLDSIHASVIYQIYWIYWIHWISLPFRESFIVIEFCHTHN